MGEITQARTLRYVLLTRDICIPCRLWALRGHIARSSLTKILLRHSHFRQLPCWVGHQLRLIDPRGVAGDLEVVLLNNQVAPVQGDTDRCRVR